MITVRNGVFETNSSSCHVLTIFSPAEQRQVLDKQAIVYAHSKSDDEANIAEVYDYVKFKHKMKEILGDSDEKKNEFIEELWKNILECLAVNDALWHCNWEELADKYKIEGTEYGEIEDFMCSCCHEEQNEYCVSPAKEIELAGIKTMVASWEASC
jgi:hypothetical protein